MQKSTLVTVLSLLGLILPNIAYAQEAMHPTIIILSATIIFLMVLTVYVVYKIRRSLRGHLDKPVE